MTYTYGWGSFRYYTRAGWWWWQRTHADPYSTTGREKTTPTHAVCLTTEEKSGGRMWEETGDGNPIIAAAAAACSSNRRVTRHPFIKCYPGCINLISTPGAAPMLLPGWEICYGWRLKDLSLESGWWMRWWWRRQRRNQWITRDNLTHAFVVQRPECKYLLSK